MQPLVNRQKLQDRLTKLAMWSGSTHLGGYCLHIFLWFLFQEIKNREEEDKQAKTGTGRTEGEKHHIERAGSQTKSPSKAN